MKAILSLIKLDNPSLHFVEGDHHSWSPKNKTVTFLSTNNPQNIWSLLHEVAHATLGHESYDSDMELMNMELDAWLTAKELAKKYTATPIDSQHIENCLDTYRNWIYKRSCCPSCRVAGVQKNSHTYICYRCSNSWKVSNTSFCRPYRKKTMQSTALSFKS